MSGFGRSGHAVGDIPGVRFKARCGATPRAREPLELWGLGVGEVVRILAPCADARRGEGPVSVPADACGLGKRSPPPAYGLRPSISSSFLPAYKERLLNSPPFPFLTLPAQSRSSRSPTWACTRSSARRRRSPGRKDPVRSRKGALPGHLTGTSDSLPSVRHFFMSCID